MKLDVMLKMTERQWDAYERATVTVPLSLLDDLADSAELLARGSRLEQNAREINRVKAEKAREIVDPAVDKIRNEWS